MINIEHPAITRIERTGYPPQHHKAIVCDMCGCQLEDYGAEFDGTAVCIDCLKEEFESLTTREKYEAMSAACGRTLNYYA